MGMAMEMAMRARAILLWGLVLLSVSPAWADDAEKIAMARVRLTTDAGVAKG